MQIEKTHSKDGSALVTNEVANTVIHLAAACASLLGASLLVAKAALLADIWKIVGFSVYGLALVGLFVFSTLHHGITGSNKVNKALRTLDYIAVFVLIAGTVTPLVLIIYRDVLGWTVLGTVWAIAIVGVVLRSISARLPKHITNTLYIMMGWLPVVLLFDKPQLKVQALILLAAGGVIYSIGFIIYVLEKPNPKTGVFGFHEIWHIMVTAAAFCHYMLMYLYVLK